MDKNRKSELLCVALILLTALLIVIGFFVYDSGTSFNKRNPSYILDTEAYMQSIASPAPTGADINKPTVLPEPTPRPSPSADDIVFISPSGSKYHAINDCSNMDPATATAISVKQAEEKGKLPCKRCWP